MKKGKKVSVKKTRHLCFLLFFFILFFPLTVAAGKADCNEGNHQYRISVQEATAEQDGKKTYTCQLCGYGFYQTLPATGHAWSSWKTERPATCMKPGKESRVCVKYSNNHHKEYRSVAALGHSYRETERPATCTNRGEKVTSCLHCGHVLSVQPYGTPAEHNYQSTVTQKATCVADGEETIRCIDCGHCFTKPIQRLSGHQYEINRTEAPGCETEGAQTAICRLCGESKTERISPLGHQYGEWVTEQEPTKNTPGKQVRICARDRHHRIEGFIASQAADFSPNVWDVLFLGTSAAMALGFSIPIYQDVQVLRWEEKQSVSYSEWMKKQRKGSR